MDWAIEDFGKRIRAERMKRKLTQTEVAKQAQVLLPLFRMIEDGKYIPPLKTMIKIMLVLNISVHELMTEQEKEILLQKRPCSPTYEQRDTQKTPSP